jgi:glyceraldehyde-3-phosphate dehydrogenase (NADP+)
MEMSEKKVSRRSSAEGEDARRCGGYVEVRDPQDGALIDVVPRAGAEDVQAAVGAAGAAPILPIHRRMEILRRAADSVAARSEEFTRTLYREGVKTIREARMEVARCVETLRLSAEEARRLGARRSPSTRCRAARGASGGTSGSPSGW